MSVYLKEENEGLCAKVVYLSPVICFPCPVERRAYSFSWCELLGCSVTVRGEDEGTNYGKERPMTYYVAAFQVDILRPKDDMIAFILMPISVNARYELIGLPRTCVQGCNGSFQRQQSDGANVQRGDIRRRPTKSNGRQVDTREEE